MGALLTYNTQLYNLINNNKDTLGVQEVYNYPKLDFKGYPAVSIYESDTRSDYETTTENERQYVWKVRIFEEIKEGGLEGAVVKMRTLQDAVVDMIDQDNLKRGSAEGQVIGLSMPANYIHLAVEPVPVVWGQTTDEELIFAELDVVVRASFDAS